MRRFQTVFTLLFLVLMSVVVPGHAQVTVTQMEVTQDSTGADGIVHFRAVFTLSAGAPLIDDQYLSQELSAEWTAANQVDRDTIEAEWLLTRMNGLSLPVPPVGPAPAPVVNLRAPGSQTVLAADVAAVRARAATEVARLEASSAVEQTKIAAARTIISQNDLRIARLNAVVSAP